MHRYNKSATTNVLQIILDLFFLFFTFLLSCLIIDQLDLQKMMCSSWLWITYIPIFVSVMGLKNMYDKTTFYYHDRVIKNIIIACMVSSLTIFMVAFFVQNIFINKTLIAFFLIFTPVIVTIERFIFIKFNKKWQKLNPLTRIIIVGTPDVAKEFNYFLNKTELNFEIIGYVDINGYYLGESQKVLGKLADLENILINNVVDEVIFALPKTYLNEVEKYVFICEEMGLTVRMILNLYDLKHSKMHLCSIGTLPMVTFHTVTLNSVSLLIKRIIDIFGSIIGLIITAVFCPLVALAIKLDSPGPIFFTQERVGLNGRLFRLYKFRSMCEDAECVKASLASQNQIAGDFMFKIKNDPRVTRVGSFLRKTSIDEFPQFMNVLKGEMSLVGTRPPTTDEVKKYVNSHRRRISIKPGITGLWQISGRSNIKNFEDVVSLDTKYIDQWSISGDIK
ncbi:MAG: sugar transferase, partial [bacterium]|nr:sugar transferase [bacterium]